MADMTKAKPKEEKKIQLPKMSEMANKPVKVWSFKFDLKKMLVWSLV